MQRKLLAFVWSDSTDTVLIDQVQRTKSGTAYLYAGQVWQRRCIALDSGLCDSPQGDQRHIKVLSHSCLPEELVNKKVCITASAKEHFDNWLTWLDANRMPSEVYQQFKVWQTQ